MNILITGAGGFIGSHLTDSQLEQGHQVRAVDLHTDLLAHLKGNDRLEVIRADITDPAAVERMVAGIDTVYHLASAHLDVSLADAYYLQVNRDATVNLVQAAERAGVKRFVHCSSVGVIGDVDNPPADETYACRPTNIYEKTKLAGEQAVVEMARDSKMKIVIARPAWVYGPRCPRTKKLFGTIAKGCFPIFGRGDNLRHPVYISDAVRGLELCAQADVASGEIYIIAGDEPVTAAELARAISQEVGAKPPRLHLPIFLGLWGGLALEIGFKLIGRRPPFSRRSVDFFLKHNAYTIAKARRDLGYQPQVDLRSGIQKTILWQKAQSEN